MVGNDWPLVPLGDLTENLDSRRVPVKELDRKPGPYPYYGASGIVDRVDGYLFEGEHLLIGEDGENLRTRQTPIAFIATGKFWVNNHAHIVRGNHRADTRFLNYVLSQTDISGYLTGSTMPKLTQGNLNRLPVIAPPLAEQKAIAGVLGSLDDKIELNRRMSATLEAMARALFQSWFVDFDPVRANLDGRSPANLDPATAALFPASFQDSAIGPMPSEWEVVRLDEISSVMMGLSPDGDTYNSDGVGIPLINGPVEFGDYFPVKTKWTQAATRFAAKDDLIFCVRGSTTGRRVVSDGRYAIGRGVCSIRANGGLHSFVYQTINFGLTRLLEKTTGSVFPSLSAPDIKGFPVLKPGNDILLAYERISKPILGRIQENHRQSRTLAFLRDTLLPKLLSGELSVSTAAETIP